jgi:hypothetical protein
MKKMFYEDVEKKLSFIDTLASNEKIKLERYKLPLKASKSLIDTAKEKMLPTPVIEFYKKANGFYIKWVTQEPALKGASGIVNILPLNEVLRSWKNVVYFDETDEMKNFVPIDFFVDEACVGVFIGESAKNSVYLYNFRSEPIRLHIDLIGYFELIFHSKGYLYWQYALNSIIENSEDTITEQFEKDMSVIFPEFDFLGFRTQYENLKLKP